MKDKLVGIVNRLTFWNIVQMQSYKYISVALKLQDWLLFHVDSPLLLNVALEHTTKITVNGQLAVDMHVSSVPMWEHCRDEQNKVANSFHAAVNLIKQ